MAEVPHSAPALIRSGIEDSRQRAGGISDHDAGRLQPSLGSAGIVRSHSLATMPMVGLLRPTSEGDC